MHNKYNNLKRLSLYIINTLLLITCALNAYADTTLDSIVAIVNNQVITASQLAHQQALYQHELISQNKTVPNPKVLRSQTLEKLINTQLQLQLATHSGITVTEKQVAQAIQSIADGNGISLQQLRQSVDDNGLSFQEYQTNIREQLIISQLQHQTLVPKVTVSDHEIQLFLKSHPNRNKNNTEYHLKYILVRLNDSSTSQQVTQAKTFAKQLKDKIDAGTPFEQISLVNASDQGSIDSGDLGWRKLDELPTLFSKHLKSMKKGTTAGPIQAANGFHLIHLEDVHHHYFKHQSEQTHLRQIMLTTTPLDNDRQVKQRLLSFRQQIKTGTPFSKIAEQYSKDPLSNTSGGDMGWVNIQELPTELQTAIKKLTPKTLSNPIKLGNRWYLIEKLATRVKDDTEEFQQQQVRQLLFKQKLETEQKKWLEEIRKSAYVKITK